MEAYHPQEPWRVTQLYTDTKQSYRRKSAAFFQQQSQYPTTNDDLPPELLSLHRKFRTQKDRLVAWGYEWSDDPIGEKKQDGNIHESVERAGLTEVVVSVLENIKGILEDVERVGIKFLRPTPVLGPSVYPLEKQGRWSKDDLAHYEDLVKDLTTSIDLLCDLSKSRRATESQDGKGKGKEAEPTNLYSTGAFPSDSEILPELNYGLSTVPKIDHSAMILPEESPPPYDDQGIPRPVRSIGRLLSRHSGIQGLHPSEVPQLPILVEYVEFDGIYQNTNMPLPMQRFDELSRILNASHSNLQSSLPQLLGYFEDTRRPRIGLIYHLPPFAAPAFFSDERVEKSRPMSLFDMLQTASQLHSNPGASASLAQPPLEDRLRLALELASGFSVLHERQFMLREISSNTIALLPKAGASTTPVPQIIYDMRKPLISSFDLFSEYNVDAAPEYLGQNIYHHPDDPRMKGDNSLEGYHTGFDLYSIGLILLEVGLWTPLADIFKEKYSLRDFKTRVEKIWTKRLAGKCGSGYMRAVQDCLAAGNNTSFSQTAVCNLYAKVLGRLQKCCLIDDGDDNEDAGEALSPSVPVQRSIQRKPLPSTDSKDEKSNPQASDARATDEPVNISSNVLKETPKRQRLEYPLKEIPVEVWEFWRDQLEGQLSKMITKILKNSTESCHFYLSSTGESEATAKPSICVGCTSTKLVRTALRKHLRYDSETYDLVVFKDKISRSKLSRAGDVRRSAGDNLDRPALNPYHHQRPLCGASIGAWKDSEHLAPVSFGGVVLIDGVPFGMSVHHLMEEPEDDEDDEGGNNETSRSSAKSMGSRSQMDLDSSDIENEESDDGSVFDDSDSEYEVDLADMDLLDEDDEEEEDDDASTEGDAEGIALGEGEEIIITQPALNDIPVDFFPCDADKDEDHLDSHTLGHVHASSGIRRLNVAGVSGPVKHEIDWALLKLEPGRLQPYNLVAGGRRYCRGESPPRRPDLLKPVCRHTAYDKPSEDFYPRKVAPCDSLAGLDVHCFGRTSGLASGKISRSMQMVRFPGRRSFSRTWSVTGHFGAGGDSGAWVIDNEHGKICGHVLAWSATRATAFIAPMDVLLEDVRKTLGAKSVSLPGAEQEARVPARTTPSSRTYHEHSFSNISAQTPPPATTGEHLWFDFSNVEGFDKSPMIPSTRPMNRIFRADSESDFEIDEDAAPFGADLELQRSAGTMSPHFLLSGNPTSLEREWNARRSALGQLA